MSYYPIFIPVDGKSCLVAGGGKVAERKVQTLLKFNARVKVVSPRVSRKIAALAEKKKIILKKRAFSPSDLDGALLAIGTTDDKKVNELISKEARKRNIPVNIVDNKSLCTFICPSIVKRGNLTIAISTQGCAPAFSKKIRKEIEATYGKEYGRIVASAGRFRTQVVTRKKVIIGSRGSRLALVQANSVAASIKKHFKSIDVEIKIIKTMGDKIKTASLADSNFTGLFVKEIQDALIKKEIDIAVHSLKDLPTKTPKELAVSAFTKRQMPNDVLVAGKKLRGKNVILALPQNAKVGTSSARRKAQLKYLRSDIITKELRGNLDTRLKKLFTSDLDAIVVACAGIKRMKAKVKNLYVIPLAQMVPCPGQGILALETRKNDGLSKKLVQHLNDKRSSQMAEIELTALKMLDGGCSAPIGVVSQVNGANISAAGCVLSADGTKIIESSVLGKAANARALGKKLGKALLNLGAKELLRSSRSSR